MSKSVGDLSGLSLKTFMKLLRCSDLLRARVNKHLANQNINDTQFGIMELVYLYGPQTQKAIAEKILKSKSNITSSVQALEERGFIKRLIGDGDKRNRTVELTDTGDYFISKLIPEHLKVIERELGILGEEEMLILSGLCNKLGSAVSLNDTEESVCSPTGGSNVDFKTCGQKGAHCRRRY